MPEALTSLGWIEWTTLALVGVVLLGVSLYLAVGLFAARSLIRREFSAYFLSPIAYVVLVVFLIVTGVLFSATLDLLTRQGSRGVEYPMRMMFGDERFWLVFLFIPPLLTMRLFAEERGTGTLEMIMTAPLRDWQIVLSKFLACYAFFLMLWLPTLVYLPVLLDLRQPVWHGIWTPYSVMLVAGGGGMAVGLLLLLWPLGTKGRLLSLLFIMAGLIAGGVGAWGNYTRDRVPLVSIQAGIDPMPALSTYLGIALAGGMFLALGLLVSSWVRSQMVAALIALILSLVFIVAGFCQTMLDSGSTLYRLVYYFSVPMHFQRDFSRGVVDIRHLVLYVSVALFCLFLTVRSLESRRWR
ncbi:MAG: ABC-2 transporter permease [Gemmataceae bacterium]